MCVCVLQFLNTNTKVVLCVQSCHIHLIDALMMAYMVEMISTEKVVSSVRRFSNFSASKEMPFDLEDAMLFWINKVGSGTKNAWSWPPLGRFLVRKRAVSAAGQL